VLVKYKVDVYFRQTTSGLYAQVDPQQPDYRLGWAERDAAVWSPTILSESSLVVDFHQSCYSTIVDATFASNISFSFSNGVGSVSFGDANPHGGWNIGLGNLLSVTQSGSCWTEN
jgi:hypothetical protein